MSPVPGAIPLLTRPFYFLRHGETESNVRRIVAGSLDVPLTEVGHAQARAAALLLKDRGVTEIYSSALRRARDTADCVAALLHLPVRVIPGLVERRWGVLEGQPRELRVPGMTPLGAETPEEFSERVMRAFAEIEAEGVPLVVAHSGVFRTLCRALGLAEPAEQIANARPVRCLPPTLDHAFWRLEPL
ncbi:MAG TPA: histidine phosphatase family protein [Terriglobales bacterium]|jgi:probable phosphoglycerate mutase|nr:histidine phosphatase family protein [Terriglobales bacterium]